MFHLSWSCWATKTGHRLAYRETQNNSAQESATLRGGTHWAQRGASQKENGSANIHDEVDEDETKLKSIDSFEIKLFFL